MAQMRIFVSSTCYDLSAIRSQLRNFVNSMGYECVMSDYNDIVYHPNHHTHTSCINEVNSCDMIILIVGSRFGGVAIPEALEKINFDELKDISKSTEICMTRNNISITQLEILKAIESEIPVFTFIDNRVWNDHELYEKNKNKPIIKDIEFPSIDRQETAKYIFEFINFLRHRDKNNSLHQFTKFDEIENILKKQWAGLFQGLLRESQYKNIENKKMDIFSEQLENLKTAILTSIGSSYSQETARGVVKYRRLIDFIKGLQVTEPNIILDDTPTWDRFLETIDIVRIFQPDDDNDDRRPLGFRRRVILLKKDGTYYIVRLGFDFIDKIQSDFNSFVKLEPTLKKVIYEALNDLGDVRFDIIRYQREQYKFSDNDGQPSLFEVEK